MSDTRRIVCPECGEKNKNKLHEEPDKSEVLYYSMQGTPVYSKKMKCGNCGHTWNK